MPPKKKPSKQSFEAKFVEDYLPRIGMVIVLMGAAFLLKYSFDQGWVTPLWQLIIGGIVGVVFLAIAELTLKKYEGWSNIMAGGGTALLYVTLFVGRDLYEYLTPEWTLLGAALITLLTGWVAIRHNSLLMAGLGFLTAYLAPSFILEMSDSFMQTNHVMSLLTLFTVTLGVLWVSHVKNWQLLNFLSFFLMFYYMQEDLGSLSGTQELPLWFTLVFVGLFWLFYTALPAVQSLVYKEKADWMDLSIVPLNAAAAYIFGTLVLKDYGFQDYYALVPIVLGALYLLWALLAGRTKKTDDRLKNVLLVLGIVLITLVAPTELESEQLTLALSLEAIALVWMGFALRTMWIRAIGLLIGIAAVLNQLFFLEAVNLQELNFFWNNYSLTLLVLALSSLVMWLLYQKYQKASEKSEHGMESALLVSTNILAFAWVSMQIVHYFMLSDVPEYNEQIAHNVFWVLYALLLMWQGIKAKSPSVRLAALLLFVGASLFLGVNTASFRGAEEAFFVNWLTLDFAVVTGAAFLLSHLYKKNAKQFKNWESKLPFWLLLAANAVLFWWLNFEILHYFELNKNLMGQQAIFSIVWALYAAFILFVGMARQVKVLRWLALTLFGVTILKVAFVDVVELSEGFRALAFLVLGAVLVIASLLYQRFKKVIKDKVL